MAEQLASYDFRRGKYPWEDWLNGQPQRIHHGVDFDCKVSSMRAYVSEAARARGLRAHVTMEGTSIVFESYDPARETP